MPRLPRVDLGEPVSILMPSYNEGQLIVEVLREWFRDVLAHLPAGSELILDDCSDDGTETLLRQLAEQHPFLRVNFSRRDGFFNAAMRLYRMAKCPLVFFTDSDGQYVAEDFWKVAEHIHACDMVHGYKSGRKDPVYRLVASAAFNAMIRSLFLCGARDVNCAFRMIRRPMLEQLLGRIRHLSMLPNAEMYVRAEWCGMRIKCVPVQHRARTHGKSRSLPLGLFGRECCKAFRQVIALRRELITQPRRVLYEPIGAAPTIGDLHASAVPR